MAIEKKHIYRGLGLVALAGGSYFMFFYKDKNSRTAFEKLKEYLSQKGMTREQAVNVIREFSKKPSWEGEGYDTDYLVARAKALKKKQKTFVVDEKTYDAWTGRAVK